ncbi:dapper homolog 3-like [Pelmatolapia mariae]|uniref:dapper homolog 3-like n=1 Tax=Pelmatolapia mariae TaxID=158779 RepID=UPI003211E0AD
MDPADSRVAMEEGSLTQLWGYCQSVTQAVDPHMRHIQVVFFDNYLSSTTFSTSFLDIDKLIHIVTELRASSSFELFGLGCPGKEDAAASLAALAAWFFLHRRRVFPPPLAAHLLDPPLQGRRCPTPSPLIPSMSSVSADKGSAALVTTVSQPDSITLLNPVSHEQEGTVSFDAAPPSRKRRRRRHLHQTEAHLTPVVSEEPADSGLAAGLAAQGAAVSEMDSVVGKDVAVMKTERASFKPRDSAQSVNNKTGIAMGNKLRRSALPESGGGPEAIPGSFSNVRSSADCFSGAGHGAFVSEPVSSKTVNSEGAGVAAKWTEAVNSELLHCANMHPETVFVAADLLTDPVLEHGSATTGNREAGILPRASPEAELEASVGSGPLDVAEAAVTLSSSQPFMLALSPSTQSAAQLVTQLSSVSASTSPARPSSSPPAATASPSSPPDQPSIAAPQPEEQLSERGEPASPTVERSEPAELSERGEPASQPAEELSERGEPAEREEPASPAVERSEPAELGERGEPTSQPEEELAEPEEEPASPTVELGEPEERLPSREGPGGPEKRAPPELELQGPELQQEPEQELGEQEECPPSREGLGRPEERAQPSEVGGREESDQPTRGLIGDHGPFYSVTHWSRTTVAGHRSSSAAATGPVAGHRSSSAAATGSGAGPLNRFVAAAGPMAVRRRPSVPSNGLEKCTPWERRVLATVVIGGPSSLLPALLQLIT